MTITLKPFIAASVVVVAAATSVQAAEVVPPYKLKVVTAGAEMLWTGFYAGGQIGGSFLVAEYTKNDTAVKMHPKGFTGNLYAGYNLSSLYNFVPSVETDFLFGSVKKNAGNDAVQAVKQNWAGATRFRVGYDMNRWMPYVAGGVAYTNLKTDLKNESDNESKKTLKGWTAGVGIDYAMTDNFFLRTEYRYNGFDKKAVGRHPEKLSGSDVHFGMGYKF